MSPVDSTGDEGNRGSHSSGAHGTTASEVRIRFSIGTDDNRYTLVKSWPQ